MALFLATGPTTEPVALAEVKDHIRVSGSDEDALINDLITSAREYIETFTGRTLMPQTWDLKLNCFPAGGAPLVLPNPPVQSVTSITYLDTAGDSQTWASSKYLTTDLPQTAPRAQMPRVPLAYAESYPSTYGVENAVTVTFVTGYTSASAVPALLRTGLKFLVELSYQRLRRSPQELNEAAIEARFLWPFKVWG